MSLIEKNDLLQEINKNPASNPSMRCAQLLNAILHAPPVNPCANCSGNQLYEQRRRRAADDLKRRRDEVYNLSIHSETLSERNWWSAYEEALEEAICDIEMGVLQIPLTLEELKEAKVVWLEIDNESETVPALMKGISDEIVYFITDHNIYTYAYLYQYGKYWRAWAYEPNGEEREHAWEDSKDDGQ